MGSASRYLEPGKVRQTFPGLTIDSKSAHVLEIRHPGSIHPVLTLEFPHQDFRAQGTLLAAGYKQRFLAGGAVEESGMMDEESEAWSCDWDTWVHQWCRALTDHPPQIVRPGLRPS